MLYVMVSNRSLDNFIVMLDDIIIPKTCWDYLVTNGQEYFLFNSKLLVDGVKNPLRFKTKTEAIEYLGKNNCPDNIPNVNLLSNKKLEDPSISFQRECNNLVAPNKFDLDICNSYASDNDTLTGKYLTKINQIENDKKLYANYDVESCMINKAITEYPELDDTHFKNNFAAYFDRLNSNIDEDYLYISGR